MKRDNAKSKADPALRSQAEQRLSVQATPGLRPLSAAEARRLVHELRVHQIEPEMQNEDLLRAQAVARQATENYTELFDFAPVAYFVLDAGGAVCDVNLAGAALLGLHRSLVAGQIFESYVRSEYRAEFAAFRGKLRPDGLKRTCELALLKADDDVCDVLVEGTVVEGDGGRGGAGWRLAVMDITARKQAETALRQAHAELERRVEERTAALQAANEQLRDEIAQRKVAQEMLLCTADELKRSNRELEQFAYAASHDLQEPLRAVGGFVRLLEYRFPGKLDAKLREYIDGAAEGANRMEELITDLLTLSRVGTAGRYLARASLDAPLNAALQSLQFSIRSANAAVERDPLPALVVDESQMAQLFQNLIANALKFRTESAPRIHVGARPNGDHWTIWVRDNGIGIDPQYFERIFQVFQRLHTRKKYPGTGIGLALCQKIVQRHGGKIWVESQPGQGATFYFSLPADSATIGETA